MSETTSVWNPTEAGAKLNPHPAWLNGSRLPGAYPILKAPKAPKDKDRAAYLARVTKAITKSRGDCKRSETYVGASAGAEWKVEETDGFRALVVRGTGTATKADFLAELPPHHLDLDEAFGLMVLRMKACAPKRCSSHLHPRVVVTVADSRLTMTTADIGEGLSEASDWMPVKTRARFRFAIDIGFLFESLGLWPLRVHFGQTKSDRTTFLVIGDAADTFRHVIMPMKLDAGEELDGTAKAQPKATKGKALPTVKEAAAAAATERVGRRPVPAAGPVEVPPQALAGSGVRTWTYLDKDDPTVALEVLAESEAAAREAIRAKHGWGKVPKRSALRAA